MTIPLIPSLPNAVTAIDDARHAIGQAIDDANGAPADLARIYIQLRQALEPLIGALNKLTDVRDGLQYKLIPESYEAHGVTSQTVLDYRITVSVMVRASIEGGKKEEAHTWLREHGFESLITETVNASSLAALARTLAEDENRELPEALFKTYTARTTSMTKAK